MTTKSVLKKLKKAYALLSGVVSYDHRAAYILEPLLPRLIAALELVEAKAKESETGIESSKFWHQRDFAREVLAIVNGETKGVVANAMIRCGLDPAAAPLNNADLVAMSGQRFADDVEEPSDKGE